MCCRHSQASSASLKNHDEQGVYNEQSFQNKDKKTKFHSGFPTFAIFMVELIAQFSYNYLV